MWIMTKDNKLVNSNRVKTICIYGDSTVRAITENNGFGDNYTLASYDTKEKCEELLCMIFNAIAKKQETFAIPLMLESEKEKVYNTDPTNNDRSMTEIRMGGTPIGEKE